MSFDTQELSAWTMPCCHSMVSFGRILRRDLIRVRQTATVTRVTTNGGVRGCDMHARPQLTLRMAIKSRLQGQVTPWPELMSSGYPAQRVLAS